jgi:hypothetical protein
LKMLIKPVFRWKKLLIVNDVEGVINGFDIDITCNGSTSVL